MLVSTYSDGLRKLVETVDEDGSERYMGKNEVDTQRQSLKKCDLEDGRRCYRTPIWHHSWTREKEK